MSSSFLFSSDFTTEPMSTAGLHVSKSDHVIKSVDPPVLINSFSYSLHFIISARFLLLTSDRTTRTLVRVFSQLPCWRLGAWLRPVSRGNRHFTVGGGRLRQSGPRPEGRLLSQPTLEGLTRSARTDSPRKVGRNKFRRGAAAAMQGGGRRREVGGEVGRPKLRS
ncbi:hypothetical protein F511_05780 [Dorcoceras hygrometricum]|uniref:Uncharacterized protein n=1 Tax=Dorcoceras hygrometricum TaxID=472368 RepID=A0A2Z7B455_9LAMI|nr:hypothetical protein F511_05780 [Dorcoceras hygrometricum]